MPRSHRRNHSSLISLEIAELFESANHVVAYCVMTFVIIAVMSSCRNIMCKSVPGSPPPFPFFFEARGEPGNKASVVVFANSLVTVN